MAEDEVGGAGAAEEGEVGGTGGGGWGGPAVSADADVPNPLAGLKAWIARGELVVEAVYDAEAEADRFVDERKPIRRDQAARRSDAEDDGLSPESLRLFQRRHDGNVGRNAGQGAK